MRSNLLATKNMRKVARSLMNRCLFRYVRNRVDRPAIYHDCSVHRWPVSKFEAVSLNQFIIAENEIGRRLNKCASGSAEFGMLNRRTNPQFANDYRRKWYAAVNYFQSVSEDADLGTNRMIFNLITHICDGIFF